MRAWIPAFALGVTVAGFLPALPGTPGYHVLLIPGLLSLRYGLLRVPGAACAGAWWLMYSAVTHMGAWLPRDLEQQDLLVGGIISGLPQYTDQSRRIVLEAVQLCRIGNDDLCDLASMDGQPRRLLLNDYGNREILPGEYWQFRVRLKRPHGFANPGGFDYERWLFQERIAATGYIREGPQNRLLPMQARLSLRDHADRLRYRFSRRLAQLPLETPGLISALTIGDRYRITDEQWQWLTLTGTNHLMVISGLHLSLVAWLAYQLAGCLFRYCLPLCRWQPVMKPASLAAFAAAAGYAALAGFSLPVQRALVMVGCVLAGHTLVRQVHPVNNLGLALAVVLLLDPLAPQSGGFWLSFVAVACLLLSISRQPVRSGHPQGLQKLAALVRSQLFLFLGMMPVLLALFRQLSLLAPLVNLVAIPFIGLLVVPLCLLALCAGALVPGWFAFLIGLPDFLLGIYARHMHALADQAGFLLAMFPALPPWMLLALAAACTLVLFRPCMAACMGLLALLIAVLRYEPDRPQPGEFAITLLDVGQGLAAVVVTHRHVLVYDTGPSFGPRFNAGSGIVLPYLQWASPGVPDLIMVSHGDNDHAGGLASIHQAYPDAPVIGGENLGLAGQSLCRAGLHWQWDDVAFRLLSPLSEGETGNAASCVLQITTGRYGVLLPGDIERDTELALVRQFGNSLKSDIMVAAHHGSMTSSSTPFLREVSASWSIFTTGYLNRFNHPHPAVVDRYVRRRTWILNTADTGAVRFQLSSATGVSGPFTWRLERRRFWSASAAGID